MKLLLFPVRTLASNQKNGLSLPRSYQSKESKYFSVKSIISNIKTFFRMKEICFNKTSQGSAMEGSGGAQLPELLALARNPIIQVICSQDCRPVCY